MTNVSARSVDRLDVASTSWLVVLAVSWGLSFLFVDVSLRALPPLWIVASRTLLGGAVLVFALLMTRGSFPRKGRTWFHICVLAATGNALPWTFIAWAQQAIPSGLAALIMAMVPTATLALSVLVRTEQLTAMRLTGLLIALGGVAIIVTADAGDTTRLISLLVTIGAALLYAVSGVYAKKFVSGHARPLEIATTQVVCAGLITLPMALWFGPRPSVAALDATVAASLATLGIFGTGIAYILLYTLIERAGATNTALVAYLIPVVAVIAGAVFLGERLGWRALIGGLFVVLGIWLSQRRTAAHPVTLLEDRPR